MKTGRWPVSTKTGGRGQLGRQQEVGPIGRKQWGATGLLAGRGQGEGETTSPSLSDKSKSIT